MDENFEIIENTKDFDIINIEIIKYLLIVYNNIIWTKFDITFDIYPDFYPDLNTLIFTLTKNYPDPHPDEIFVIVNGLSKIIRVKPFDNYKPLWYINFGNSGNISVLINISANIVSIIVTSYIGDSLMHTAGFAILATMKVAQIYGYKNTVVGLVTDKNTIPLYIYQNLKLLTQQSFNDYDSVKNYLEQFFNNILLTLLAISLLYYLKK